MMASKDNQALADNLVSDQMYILGLPIELPIGTIYPIRVNQYEILAKHMASLFMDIFDIRNTLKSLCEENINFEPLLEYAKMVDFFTFVMAFKSNEYEGSFLHDLYIGQKELFKFLFKEDVFDKIGDNDSLEMYRKKIVNMNNIQYKKPNPNPELARLDDLKSKLSEMKGENITFEAMYTSVLLSCPLSPNDLTLYQINKAFDRVMHFKNYDTSTLFKTVDQSGKMDISPWYGTTKEEAPATITQSQLDRAKELQNNGGYSTDL